MDAIDDIIDMTVLVEDTDGEPLLWLETDADGVTTLNDNNNAVPFDPNEEDLDAAVKEWKEAVGLYTWRFTVTWPAGVQIPRDWDEWSSDDLLIDSNGPEGGVADLFVRDSEYEDALDYIESVIVEGMSIEEVAVVDEDE